MEFITYEIKLLPEELWWGGRIDDGVYMPYGKTKFVRDSLLHNGNQASPLLISNKGRYVWNDYPILYTFDNGTLTLSYQVGKIEYGEGHKDLPTVFKYVSEKYFPASGILPDPLNFTAPQYNNWIQMMYDPTEEKLLNYAQEILDRGMAPGVLMLDDNWMNYYGDWNFYPGKFPNPKKMVERLHEMGFKLMLWLVPYISPDSVNFRMLLEKGYLLMTEEKSPHIKKWWNGYSAVIDFSNPDAVAWLQNELDSLVERYGIDGFKFDGGSPILGKYGPGKDGQWNKNIAFRNEIYPSQDCENYAKMGIKYKLNEFRECWKCGGQPLIHRLKDKRHAWTGNGLDSLIPNSIAQGLMGYPFNCPDMIGGGIFLDFLKDGERFDEELFVRYAQCSALFPIMQYSLAPWKAVKEEYVTYCIDMAKLRTMLAPEIILLAEHASKTNEPILRSLAYVYPDAGYEMIKDQFMLGNDILVAPVLEKGSTKREIIFPEGKWLGDDGSVVRGPAKLEINAPLSRLPWYRRALN